RLAPGQGGGCRLPAVVVGSQRAHTWDMSGHGPSPTPVSRRRGGADHGPAVRGQDDGPAAVGERGRPRVQGGRTVPCPRDAGGQAPADVVVGGAEEDDERLLTGRDAVDEQRVGDGEHVELGAVQPRVTAADADELLVTVEDGQPDGAELRRARREGRADGVVAALALLLDAG